MSIGTFTNVVLLCVEALTALGGLVVAGLFASETFVLRSFRDQPTIDRIKTMAAVNLAIAGPVAIVLSGTALLCLPLALAWSFVWSWDWLEEPVATMAVTGGIVFGVGAVLVTLERTKPLDRMLGTATDASGDMIWRIYRRDRARWNHVRTAAGAVTGALFAAVVVVHGLHVIDIERFKLLYHGDPCATCEPVPFEY